VPKEGDVFLWRYSETNKKGKTTTHGHTGIVKSYDSETGQVTILHARGTDYGTVEEVYDLSYFTGHAGWKGFYTPATDEGEFLDNAIKDYTTLAEATFDALENVEEGSSTYKSLTETLTFYTDMAKQYKTQKADLEKKKSESEAKTE
jgi:hypothetical protein